MSLFKGGNCLFVEQKTKFKAEEQHQLPLYTTSSTMRLYNRNPLPTSSTYIVGKGYHSQILGFTIHFAEKQSGLREQIGNYQPQPPNY